jgi:hypothetical protein
MTTLILPLRTFHWGRHLLAPIRTSPEGLAVETPSPREAWGRLLTEPAWEPVLKTLPRFSGLDWQDLETPSRTRDSVLAGRLGADLPPLVRAVRVWGSGGTPCSARSECAMWEPARCNLLGRASGAVLPVCYAPPDPAPGFSETDRAILAELVRVWVAGGWVVLVGG